ncbi:IS66 family transposase [Paludisphaera mucosa]|uniref:IS66 family transposase n=1 Tax=Paludisphaera mucosa TaxID=3030827 RepID=A0ABT6F4C4_9BACT|nr:IS66 family transposase [Paludisphaera mucosa]MDG3002420.1 IS66 family transposase [Paludisphaera mucosa]
MTRPACIPAEYWDALPAELRPGLLAIVAAFEARIAAQDARIAELEARLDQNSSNSSRPPSSDPPHLKSAPPREPSGRRRGGQPGHRRNDRIRLEPDEVVDVGPDRCRRRGEGLAGDDRDPLVRQVFELPVVRPHVVEYRLHRSTCPRCGESPRGVAPVGAEVGYGPRAQAACAVLAGEGRMGKRLVARVMRGLFGLPIGPAAICDLERRTADALAPAHAEALGHIRGLPANVDKTSWPQGRRRGWLWAALANGLGVFRVAAGRGRDAFEALMGRSPPAVVTSDRYSAYAHLPAERRQACWARLRRDFQAMLDRADAGKATGEELLLHSGVLFDAWSKVRAGAVSRGTFASRTLPWLRREVRALLRRGVGCGAKKTAATCREILKVEASLWTFAKAEGVEPTNNAAERALRQAVCRRKTSFGTDSPAGSRFVERILTAIESCCRQSRDLLDFLVEAVEARRSGGKPPSLVPAGA